MAEHPPDTFKVHTRYGFMELTAEQKKEYDEYCRRDGQRKFQHEELRREVGIGSGKGYGVIKGVR